MVDVGKVRGGKDVVIFFCYCVVIALIPSPLLSAFQVGTFCMNVFITFNTILLLAIKKCISPLPYTHLKDFMLFHFY